MNLPPGSERSLAQVERELQEERAAALGRIAGRLEELLARWRRERQELDTAPPQDRAAAAEALDRRRDEVRLWRWYLEVQREAVGLFDQRPLQELYPLPEAVGRAYSAR